MGIAAAPAPSASLGLAPRILIADDQADVRLALELLLKGAGFRTQCADSPDALLAGLERGAFAVFLSAFEGFRRRRDWLSRFLMRQELPFPPGKEFRFICAPAVGKQPWNPPSV